jgi:hypothetical protein
MHSHPGRDDDAAQTYRTSVERPYELRLEALSTSHEVNALASLANVGIDSTVVTACVNPPLCEMASMTTLVRFK